MAHLTDEEFAAAMKFMPQNHDVYVSDPSVSGRIGVLVLTHGFSEAGDAMFVDALRGVATKYPTAVAFGMAMMNSEHIQSAVEDLAAAGAETIVAVCACHSRNDTLIFQYEYILGQQDEPAYLEVPQVKTGAEIRVTEPFADHPLVTDILHDHAREYSSNPADEVVIIVGHGPWDIEDNAAELAMLENHVMRIKRDSDFAEVRVINLQDDALSDVRARNVQQLRQWTEDAVKNGQRVIIVGFLVGTAGIQRKIKQDLAGLDYEFNPRGLTEHPNFEVWVSQMVGDATDQS
jgi:hypothetical protein